MARHDFKCIDGHACGNPVRVVTDGGPDLSGETMLEKRAHFLAEYDWIRQGLMFEPRGHDVMSGTILYPPTRSDCDIAFLYIETSGCLPMCGHGTIGTVTTIIEEGLVNPREPGVLAIDTPAGLVHAEYRMDGKFVKDVRLTNVPSFLHATNLQVRCPELGTIAFDVAYGGNFYAIVEIQENFPGLDHVSALDLVRWSPLLRSAIRETHEFVHPENADISGLRHILWADSPKHPEATARNAVFYGEKAIDRSPCGTGTSARMAQWAARGDLRQGDEFIHESIIGSLFRGRVERVTEIAQKQAIVPSVAGWGIVTGYNHIIIDDRDPFAYGFTV